MDIWHFLEEKTGNGKARISGKPSFYLGKTVVFKVRQVRQIARSFEEGTLFFHQKIEQIWAKIDAKTIQKTIQNSKGLKHDGKCASISIFWMPTAIFGRFWDPLGSQNGLQNGPWEWKLGLNWALGVPREPQEPILVDFWSILESFWVPGWSFWDPSGTLFGAYGSKQQQIAAKMAILGPYLAVFCSKKQQTSAKSYK